MDQSLKNSISSLKLSLYKENKYNKETVDNLYKLLSKDPEEVYSILPEVPKKTLEEALYSLKCEFEESVNCWSYGVREVYEALKEALQKENRYNREVLNDIEYLFENEPRLVVFLDALLNFNHGYTTYEKAYFLMRADVAIMENEFLHRDPVGYSMFSTPREKSVRLSELIRETLTDKERYDLDVIKETYEPLMSELIQTGKLPTLLSNFQPKEVTYAYSLLAEDLGGGTTLNSQSIMTILAREVSMTDGDDPIEYKAKMHLVDSILENNEIIHYHLRNFQLPDILTAIAEMENYRDERSKDAPIEKRVREKLQYMVGENASFFVAIATLNDIAIEMQKGFDNLPLDYSGLKNITDDSELFSQICFEMIRDYAEDARKFMEEKRSKRTED